jgi:hypothetical protein
VLATKYELMSKGARSAIGLMPCARQRTNLKYNWPRSVTGIPVDNRLPGGRDRFIGTGEISRRQSGSQGVYGFPGQVRVRPTAPSYLTLSAVSLEAVATATRCYRHLTVVSRPVNRVGMAAQFVRPHG